MQQICKAIGHYLRNENKTVILDLGLQNNEVLLFEESTVYFVGKEKIKDMLAFNQGLKQSQNGTDTQSIFGRSTRSRGRLNPNTIKILEASNSLEVVKDRYQDEKS